MLSEENEIAILELKQLVEKSRDLREEDFYTIFTIHEVQNIATVLNLITKQQKQLELIKEYAHQEIVSYTETIRDYTDDDKEGNKHIIGEMKELREHWKDIEKILQNKLKEELYMNWWRYGLYE